jgi:hypothetical protein
MTDETVSLRRSLLWGAIAFGVALAVVIGVRLDQAALAVVVGVSCGLGASVPAGLLIVALLRRRGKKQEGKQRQIMGQSPPVVVITSPTAPQTGAPGRWPEEYTLQAPTQRQFAVIGEEETEEL